MIGEVRACAIGAQDDTCLRTTSIAKTQITSGLMEVACVLWCLGPASAPYMGRT